VRIDLVDQLFDVIAQFGISPSPPQDIHESTCPTPAAPTIVTSAQRQPHAVVGGGFIHLGGSFVINFERSPR
jgi:hypothetical protein